MKRSDIFSMAALVVAIVSALFSYVQSETAKHQLDLAKLQIRPYVKYIPVFSISKARHLVISIASEDLSAVPAYNIYFQLTPWVDGVRGGHVFNRTGDILYEHKGGEVLLPEMPTAMEQAIILGKAELMIGICVVYGSISPSDTRRWEFRALYSYTAGAEFAETQYVREIEVPKSTDRCDSVTIRSEWVQAHSKAG